MRIDRSVQTIKKDQTTFRGGRVIPRAYYKNGEPIAPVEIDVETIAIKFDKSDGFPKETKFELRRPVSIRGIVVTKDKMRDIRDSRSEKLTIEMQTSRRKEPLGFHGIVDYFNQNIPPDWRSKGRKDIKLGDVLDSECNRGHVLAKKLGGPDVDENIVPQLKGFQGQWSGGGPGANSGEWYELEEAINKKAGDLLEDRNSLFFETEIEYQNFDITGKKGEENKKKLTKLLNLQEVGQNQDLIFERAREIMKLFVIPTEYACSTCPCNIGLSSKKLFGDSEQKLSLGHVEHLFRVASDLCRGNKIVWSGNNPSYQKGAASAASEHRLVQDPKRRRRSRQAELGVFPDSSDSEDETGIKVTNEVLVDPESFRKGRLEPIEEGKDQKSMESEKNGIIKREFRFHIDVPTPLPLTPGQPLIFSEKHFAASKKDNGVSASSQAAGGLGATHGPKKLVTKDSGKTGGLELKENKAHSEKGSIGINADHGSRDKTGHKPHGFISRVFSKIKHSGASHGNKPKELRLIINSDEPGVSEVLHSQGPRTSSGLPDSKSGGEKKFHQQSNSDKGRVSERASFIDSGTSLGSGEYSMDVDKTPTGKGFHPTWLMGQGGRAKKAEWDRLPYSPGEWRALTDSPVDKSMSPDTSTGRQDRSALPDSPGEQSMSLGTPTEDQFDKFDWLGSSWRGRMDDNKSEPSIASSGSFVSNSGSFTSRFGSSNSFTSSYGRSGSVTSDLGSSVAGESFNTSLEVGMEKLGRSSGSERSSSLRLRSQFGRDESEESVANTTRSRSPSQESFHKSSSKKSRTFVDRDKQNKQNKKNKSSSTHRGSR